MTRSKERAADVEAALAELKHELWLAIKQGDLKDGMQWSDTISAEGVDDPFVVLLTVAPVGERST